MVISKDGDEVTVVFIDFGYGLWALLPSPGLVLRCNISTNRNPRTIGLGVRSHTLRI